MLLRNWRAAPGARIAHIGVSHDLELQAIGIDESENLFFETRALELRRDAELPQSIFPVPQRRLGNAERGRAYCPNSRAASSDELPGKEGENGTWVADLIAKIEMICSRIVEIDGLLY